MSIFAVYSAQESFRQRFPLYQCRIQAGFPSPADDYLEGSLDLNRLMVTSPSSTFFVQVAGDSMIESGIFEGDYLVVDRALKAINGKVVVAAIDGELTVKRFYRWHDHIELRPDNTAYSPITVENGRELVIWGVVTGVIRKTH